MEYRTDFVKIEKDKLIKLVQPNFIYNRFDIFYDNEYELFKIYNDTNTYYVPVHFNNYMAEIGVYLAELPKEAFDSLIKFIFHEMAKIDLINVKHSLNDYDGLKKGNSWVIDLPESQENFLNSLGEKTSELNKTLGDIEHDFDVKIKIYDKDIPTEIVEKYFEFQKATLGLTYKTSEQKYLQEYQVTRAIVLYLNNEISAVSFVCTVDDCDSVYLENFSCDKELSKYSLGTVIIYKTICNLIESGYKHLYIGSGDYLYKKNFAAREYTVYSGEIKRTSKKRKFQSFCRKMFQYHQDNNFYYLRLFGARMKFRKKTENCPLEINKDTRCLMVNPHPDDELFGAGTLMVKYSNNFDCLCVGSSGVAAPDMTARDRSKVRVKEFNDVMETIGIKNHWIFETYGKPRFDGQMDAHFEGYCKVLSNLKQYDYIFLPHPKDGHHEHRHITNKLFKRIIKKVGVNPKCKIVFYEVWEDMKKPNVFFDSSGEGFLFSKYGHKKYQPHNSKLFGTSNLSLLELKYKLLAMYDSQWKYNTLFCTTTIKKCLENGKNPIWRFKVVPVKEYVK